MARRKPRPSSKAFGFADLMAMKLVSFRRSRIIKLVCAIVLLICVVAFFLPKPTGDEYYRERVSRFWPIGAGRANLSYPFVHPKQRGPFKEQEEVSPPMPVFRKDRTLGNFEPKRHELRKVKGPGEGGVAYHVPERDRNSAADSNMQYGMNVVASDHISPNRSVPDMRLEECKYWDYPEDLPTTSVVVVFHNEGLSVLMRTVHSVINRSPRQFLKEVVLVDDYSDKENLKGELETYIAHNFPRGLVRLVRNREREGLIRSRSYGAEQSHGDVVLFLDAHCEVGINWLPPLLAPIRANKRAMTVPVIDGIDKDTFEYRPVYHGRQHFRGIFEWGMLYKEIEIPDEEIKRRKYHSEPYKSPTHAGGLFAINREYFLELGGYDPGLLVWGGENFELSFKIWQCGGMIYWVPCSRVGHVYRGFMPYSFGKLAQKRKGPLITVNYKRVVEVWMDEYKEYFYTREPLATYYDAGDLSTQLALREKLKCKSFRWFMKNVAYDVLKNFPLLPRNLYWGEIRHDATGQCLDAMGAHPPSTAALSACHGTGGNQVFRLNAEGQLGLGERCMDANTNSMDVVYCSLGTVDGPWEYSVDTQHLYHKTHKKCLSYSKRSYKVHLEKCDDSSLNQQWTFREIQDS
ncbi:N-acetylgalactosaminyltransferase 7 isoform X2 [Dermacentor variabilis]|uniref:N-acetylgalactosaminyltransferase 7 isoform X2 n=1 Tax=Dermacentor variabilis TaxID=34621 RepID=UPI003F5B11E4